jgi:hypothetical protein
MSRAEQLDALVRGLAVCTVTPEAQIDPACGAAVALEKWSERNREWIDASPREASAVGARYLKNRSAPVRAVAVRLAAMSIETDSALRATLTDLFATESEPVVQVALARAAGSWVSDAALRGHLAKLLDAPVARLRLAAADALVPQSGPPVEAARELVLVTVAGGQPDVRRRVCSRLRVGDDPVLLDAVAKILDAPDTDERLFETCFMGLALSAVGDGVEPRSRAAYDRVMACLDRCPRDARHDTGLGISAIEATRRRANTEGRGRLPEFVDVARFEALLVALAKDERATPSLRVSAFSALGDFDTASERTGVPWETIAALAASAAQARPAPAAP